MDYQKQKIFFKKAYDLGNQRIVKGYGWPNEVDPQVIKFFQFIKDQVKSGKALDIGCGQGRHALYLAQQGLESYGIDYLVRPIQEAKETAKKLNLSNAHFKVTDLFNLEFPENYFDLIIDWSVLDHVHPNEWNIYLKNILKVLKVNGYLCLIEFSASDSRIKNKLKNFAMDKGSYDHYFREDELKTLFSNNFDFVKTEESILGTPPPHIMINLLLKRRV